MDYQGVLDFFGNLVYVAQGVLALWGTYAIFNALRQIRRRRFKNEKQAESFLDTLRSLMEEGDFDSAVRLCDEPVNLSVATSILSRTAIVKRHLAPAKLRQLLAAKFDREIISPIENQRAAIDTVAKSQPMLGLLGTVGGMIGAFSEIGSAQRVNPQVLAENISFALITTAVGLVVAIPMVLASSHILVRMRSLEDGTVEGLQVVLEDLEAASTT